MTHRRSLVALALLLATSGCDGLVTVCRACLDHDPGRPLTRAEIARVSLVRGDVKPPAGATQIFYHEECGIDCAQWLRFDADIAEADGFARRLLGTAPSIVGGETGAGPVDGEAIRGWWPARWPAGTVTGKVDTDPRPASVAILRCGGRARVWARAFET